MNHSFESVLFNEPVDFVRKSDWTFLMIDSQIRLIHSAIGGWIVQLTDSLIQLQQFQIQWLFTTQLSPVSEWA